MSGAHMPDVEREAYAFAKARAEMEADAFGAGARLLSFLQAYPAGPLSRQAAEEVETFAAKVESPAKRELLHARLRELRDPHLPPIRAESWEMSDSRRRLSALEQADGELSSEDEPGAQPRTRSEAPPR